MALVGHGQAGCGIGSLGNSVACQPLVTAEFMSVYRSHHESESGRAICSCLVHYLALLPNKISPVPPILPNASVLTLPYEILGANETLGESGVGNPTGVHCWTTNNEARRASGISIRSRITRQPSAGPRCKLEISVSQQFRRAMRRSATLTRSGRRWGGCGR